MAFYTIEKRQKQDGSTRYRCVVGIKSGGKYTHREYRADMPTTLTRVTSGIVNP